MTQELVLLTAFACALSAGLLYDLISTAYRSLMAPQIRRALNACHDEIEFAKLNHVASSPSASLQKLSQANSAFQMAKRSLDAGHYKLCLAQAQSALLQIRQARQQLVICHRPMPVFPSYCIVSSPDNLQWMGQ